MKRTDYLEILNNIDLKSRERLLFGDWKKNTLQPLGVHSRRLLSQGLYPIKVDLNARKLKKYNGFYNEIANCSSDICVFYHPKLRDKTHFLTEELTNYLSENGSNAYAVRWHLNKGLHFSRSFEKLNVSELEIFSRYEVMPDYNQIRKSEFLAIGEIESFDRKNAVTIIQNGKHCSKLLISIANMSNFVQKWFGAFQFYFDNNAAFRRERNGKESHLAIFTSRIIQGCRGYRNPFVLGCESKEQILEYAKEINCNVVIKSLSFFHSDAMD